MKIPSPIQQLFDPIFQEKGLEVYIKRDDLIHPVISGNKWRKLQLYIEKFKQEGYEKLLTFGGAYSNHIVATARAGKLLGVPTIGVIRGDELKEDSNESLKQASSDGMELIFTSREEYDLKDEVYYENELRRRHGHILIVPEGGAGIYGVLGCQNIVNEIPFEFDYIVTASGTSTTTAGLLLEADQFKVVAISALKGEGMIRDQVSQRLYGLNLVDEELTEYIDALIAKEHYHFGGYAKWNAELINFINHFYILHNIQLDHIYTGKMMFGLYDMIAKDEFPSGSKIVALHTGGLQGNNSVRSLLNF
ncbi:MAG: pyridoxal-phosphate dependent enzyme [Crocinitomicaceae bacterium]|nr:pyridoxal-phosphate dependent enzyme [Crocinitomicaceae bacterium]